MTWISHEIPFALKNGEIVEISAVESGLACGCICVSCHSPLIARKGSVRVHHFSHTSGVDCVHAGETAIHRMAKQILLEEKSILLPELYAKAVGYSSIGKRYEKKQLIPRPEGQRIFFKTVEDEVWIDGIRPDIVGYVGASQYAIEIAVTHIVDLEKRQKIRDKGLYALEIKVDYDALGHVPTKAQLRHYLFNFARKEWLSNPDALPLNKQLKIELEQEILAINEEACRNREHFRKISEAALKRKQEQQEQQQQAFEAYKARVAAENLEATLINKKDESDLAWLVCDNRSCKHLFRHKKGVVPVHCPRCQLSVSPEDCDSVWKNKQGRNRTW